MPMEDFGADVRIEQRFAPVRPAPRSLPGSTNVALTKSGRVITTNVPHTDADGNPIWAWVIYRREVVVNGINPWTGEATSDTHVWMPVEERDTYEEARARAQELAGS